jgi:hypothetical protein
MYWKDEKSDTVKIMKLLNAFCYKNKSLTLSHTYEKLNIFQFYLY